MTRAYKRPEERQTFVYDFADQLGDATIAAIAVGTPVAVARDGGALITVFGAADVGSTTIAVTWQGGVDGESYLTTVRVTDTAGEVHAREGEIVVQSADFSVPIGIASRYLTGEEYAARVGSAETIRLTDEVRSGTVDTAKLEGAIGDATDEADGYIGTRYTIPLLSPPRVVKSIVTALAREKLHKTRPTPEVTAAADRARVQLRDISAGRMTLPIEEGAEAATGVDRDAVTSGDGIGSTFVDGLGGFVGFNYQSGGLPNWRR